MTLRLTEAADADIENILRDTFQLFGPKQLQAYAALIESALDRGSAYPLGLGTIERADVGPGVRKWAIRRWGQTPTGFAEDAIVLAAATIIANAGPKRF